MEQDKKYSNLNEDELTEASGGYERWKPWARQGRFMFSKKETKLIRAKTKVALLPDHEYCTDDLNDLFGFSRSKDRYYMNNYLQGLGLEGHGEL